MTAIDRPDTAVSSAPGGLVKSVVELDRVVIRLAGDSGDGMQLTGNRFTSETASFGNDLSKYPTLVRIFDACMSLPAFDQAHPSKQPDAEP